MFEKYIFYLCHVFITIFILSKNMFLTVNMLHNGQVVCKFTLYQHYAIFNMLII